MLRVREPVGAGDGHRPTSRQSVMATLRPHATVRLYAGPTMIDHTDANPLVPPTAAEANQSWRCFETELEYSSLL